MEGEKTKTVMKTILYNGLPIKLSRNDAKAELKQAISFCEKLKVNIESGRVDSEDKMAKVTAILKRREEWIQKLTEYLAVS